MRLQDRTPGAAIAVRAGRAVPRHGEAHDAGVDGGDRLVVEAEPVEGAGAVVVEEDVGLGEQPPEDLAPGLVLQVEGEGALVALHLVEGAVAVPGPFARVGVGEDAGAVGGGRQLTPAPALGRAHGRAVGPEPVAARAGMLDADHVRAEVGAEAGGERSRPGDRELDDAHAF